MKAFWKKSESVKSTPPQNTPKKGNPIILTAKSDAEGNHFRNSNTDETRVGISFGELSQILASLPGLVEQMRVLNKQIKQ